MKDFNFFSIFDQRQSSKSEQTAKIMLVVLLVVLVVAGAYLMLVFKYNSIMDENERIEGLLASPSAQSVMNQADTYNSNITSLNRYKYMIEEAATNLRQGHLFTGKFMDALAGAMPTGATVYTLNVGEDGSIVFVFSVPDLTTAARLTDSMDNLEYLKNVSVGAVVGSNTDEGYTVTLSAYLTGGDEQ